MVEQQNSNDSLNKFLFTGPGLLKSLIHLLFRFRQQPYAVSANFEGIFFSTRCRFAFRSTISSFFLWREYFITNVLVYQNTRHIFGAKDLPTSAIYSLKRTAGDSENYYNKASKSVLE